MSVGNNIRAGYMAEYCKINKKDAAMVEEHNRKSIIKKIYKKRYIRKSLTRPRVIRQRIYYMKRTFIRRFLQRHFL